MEFANVKSKKKFPLKKNPIEFKNGNIIEFMHAGQRSQ